MQVEDLDISPSKIGETAQRIIDRASEESRRREHTQLTNEHIFLAFAQVEWDMFAEVMRDIGQNPHTILQAIEELQWVDYSARNALQMKVPVEPRYAESPAPSGGSSYRSGRIGNHKNRRR